MQQQEEGGEMNGKPQAQQPQKCPRCDSLNTKFCYYNNYSLSQPRYFCKSCRRYWTQGGTLRNVLVGGGCRKPKRSKGSASSSSSSADTSSAPSFSQPPREVAEIQKDTSAAWSASAAAVPLISPFYQGGACGDDGGYLSSLAAIQSPFNQMGSCSNLSLLSGFGVPPIRPSSQPFYQTSAIRDKEEENLYEADQVLIQSSTANSGSASTHRHHDWTESFINNVNHRGPDASLWSTTMSTTSTSGNSRSHNDTVGGSFSFIPNHQWPDLPEYDPPPPP